MSIDIDVVAENLVELLTNSVNMTDKFYDLFINPTPMIVELQQYNSENELITVEVPNRAMDRRIAIVGTGSPEGSVSANIGTIYVDDGTNVAYVKVSGTGSVGWTILLTQDGVVPLIEAYLSSHLATVATTGSYYDLIDAPVIPTVNDAKLTIQTNGTTVGLFSANASTNVNINLAIPTKTSDLNNDSGFITASNIPVATPSIVGVVKPDDKTISVAADGTISSNISPRNIGEIIKSLVPLTDAGLHLLDGAVLSRSGIYSDFVDYMVNLYNTLPKGSNIATVGTITHTDGVISGFSSSDFATTQNTVNFGIGSSWEIVIKTDYVVPSVSTGFASNTLSASSTEAINFFTTTAGKIGFEVYVDGAMRQMYTGVLSESTYWIKAEFTGTEYKLSTSTDGETFTVADSYTSSSPSVQPVDRFRLGVDRAGNPYNSSIDLNGCYININGQRYWTGRVTIGFTDESDWQNFVSEYGSCGKFVYDSINSTIRLPKVSDILEGTTDANEVGELIAAGLPNITGELRLRWGAPVSDNETIGAITVSHNDETNYTCQTSGSNPELSAFIDASRSSSIYGNSNTVQPQTIKCLYYIVIATSQKTDIQVDIDQIAVDLNGKADVDLTNVNNMGTSKSARWAMPSGIYIDLSFTEASPASYTAPANGYYQLWKASTASTDFICLATSGGVSTVSVPDSSLESYMHSFVPVKKGDTMTVTYSGTGAVQTFRFVFAEGSKYEA